MRAFVLTSIMLGSATQAFAQGAQPCYDATAPNQYVEKLVTCNVDFSTYVAALEVLAITVYVTMGHAGPLIRKQKSFVSQLQTSRSIHVRQLPTYSQSYY
jgi:hypothetical protein